MKNGIITLFLLHFIFIGFSQDAGYDIMGTNLRYTINEQRLTEAKTISDINPDYPSSWIRTYVSVEVSATNNGEVMKAVSTDDKLNEEQLRILKKADINTDVAVDVRYYPENTLKHNDVKRINFALTLTPDVKAEYPGGYDLLKQYLKENAIEEVSEKLADRKQSATVEFIVNEAGKVTDAQIAKTSGDEEIDKILLQTINKMQDWKPAESTNGVKVKQEFQLVVGFTAGC